MSLFSPPPDPSTYRFVPLNVGKGSKGFGGNKVSSHRLFVVDSAQELPSRVWLALKKRAEVFVPNSKGERTYVYELVLGRKPTDRERIMYNDTDPLNLRKANLSYINIYDPTVPQAIFVPRPNTTVERLQGYEAALSSSYKDYETIRLTQKQEHGWAVAAKKSALSKETVLALLNFYAAPWSDAEIAQRTDKRLGTDMDTCRQFLIYDCNIPTPPSERHIRNILKGKSLRLQGQDALYAKIAKLLPTYKSLLKPLPKTPMFQPVTKQTAKQTA